MTNDHKSGTRLGKLHLEILGVCRGLFEEAHLLLWGSNRFAFHNHEAFHLFLKSLNMSQKRKLTSISLIMHWDSLHAWGLDNSKGKHVAALNNISDVEVCIHMEDWLVVTAMKEVPYSKSHMPSTRDFPKVSECLLILAGLNLKACSVTFRGDFAVGSHHPPGFFLLKNDLKVLLGRAFSAELLDSNGKDRVDAEDRKRREAEQEYKNMKAAASASGARFLAHRHLENACMFERQALQSEAKLKKASFHLSRERANKHMEVTRHAIQKADEKHKKALEKNEQYSKIWAGKEWWNDTVELIKEERGLWFLQSCVGPSASRASYRWSEELELDRIHKAKAHHTSATDETTKSEDGSPFEKGSPKAHASSSEKKGEMWEWYQDDKTILRRLLDFP